MKKTILRVLATTLFILGSGLLAAPGDLDSSFNGVGYHVESRGVTSEGGVGVLPSGKIMVSGLARYFKEFGFISYLSGGTLDGSFGVNGFHETNLLWGGYTTIKGMAIQSDGKVLSTAIGHDGTLPFAVIIRFNTDGSLDNTFGNGGYVTTNTLMPGISFQTFVAYEKIALQPSGKIIVMRSDESDFPEPGHSLVVVRFNSNGTPDTTFGPYGNGVVKYDFDPGQSNGVEAYGLAIDPAGRILVSGRKFVNNYSSSAGFIARFNVNGTIDTSFNGSGHTIVSTNTNVGLVDLSVDPQGRILSTGNYGSSTSTCFVARVSSAGVLDNSFGSGGVTDLPGDYSCLNIRTRATGAPVVSGTEYNTSNNKNLMVARFDSSGNLLNSFANGGIMSLGAPTLSNYSQRARITLQSDGMILFTAQYYDSIITGRLEDTALTVNPAPPPIAAVASVPLGQLVKADPFSINNLSEGAYSPITVVNGEYSINQGRFTSDPGFVKNEDTVTIRHRTPEEYGVRTVTTVYFGGIPADNNPALILGERDEVNFVSVTQRFDVIREIGVLLGF